MNWEDGYEEDPISEELPSLVQTAVDFSERGDGYSAIAILETITSTCVENWEDVAEYGADNEQIVEELNELGVKPFSPPNFHPGRKRRYSGRIWKHGKMSGMLILP